MSHWLDKAFELIEANTSDLRELAKLSGTKNIAQFYVGANMDGVDVRGQDLTGLAFSEIDRTKIVFDERTVFGSDFRFKPTNELENAIIKCRQLIENGNYEDAISILLHFNGINGNDIDFFEVLAEAAYKARKYPLAIDALERLINIEEKEFYLIRLANSFKRSGQPEKSLIQYKYAIQKFPNSHQAHLSLANEFLKQDKIDEYKILMLDMIDKFPHDQRIVQKYLIALLNEKKFSQALEFIDSKSNIETMHPSIASTKINILLSQKKENEAIIFSENFVKARNYELSRAFVLLKTYISTGRHKQAISYVDELLRNYHQDMGLWKWRARVFAAMGDISGQNETYKKASEAFPNSEVPKFWIDRLKTFNEYSDYSEINEIHDQ